MPTQESDHEIRERAYKLWQEAGSPDGREHEFWHKACEQLGVTENENKRDLDNAGKESFPASDPVNRM